MASRRIAPCVVLGVVPGVYHYKNLCYNEPYMQTISIIGAGEIGTAIGQLVQRPGFTVHCWDKDPAKNPEQKPLAEIVPESSVVFLCVPSWAMRSALTTVAPLLRPEAVVISLAKGIETETHKWMDEVLEELLPSGAAYALLGGPLLAEELTLGMLGVSVISTKEKTTFDQIHTILAVPTLRLEWANDPHLTALQGVLKNVYAVALGIADGLAWGSNAKGWLTAQCVQEMNSIIHILHSKDGTAISTAGLGDFIATAYSPYSRNREFGQRLVKTGACELKSEGCIALPSLNALLGASASTYPLLLSLSKILLEHQDVKTIYTQLVQQG